MATIFDIDSIIAKVNIRKENEMNVKNYLEKVVKDLDFNIDAYELKLICVAYNDGLNAR